MKRFTLLFLLLSLTGCGGSFSSVEGTVTLDGKPLPGASVQFVPQESGRVATAGTDSSGHFVMSTADPGDGVIPGSYKVVITPPAGVADTTQYASSDDAMNAAAKAPAKKATGPTVPAKYTRPDQTPLTQEVPVSGSLKFDIKSTD
jgi:hypothetical protein